MRRLLAAAALAAVALCAPVTGHAQSRLAVHTMPVRTTAAPRSLVGAPPITFHGGAVMTGHVNIYLIWYGNWPASSGRRAIITDFVRHLPSPWWAINQTYPGSTGKVVSNDISLAGEYNDRYSLGKANLTDDQIGTVVTHAIQSHALPKDTHGVYLVLTSADVTKLGFLTQYCGWHTFDKMDGSTIKFGYIGDPSGPKVTLCIPTVASPNGDPGGDAMVSTIAHELAETVTDPTMNGWRTSTGEENADRCAWNYGPTYKLGGATANMRLGMRHFLVQTNWVNDRRPHCALA